MSFESSARLETLGITKSRSSGLQAAYFGAYPLASLGHANWLLRHYGYKVVFIWGLFLYGAGSLIAWPCILYRSFGGFCAAIFVIGNGLGSLETAANPYLAVCGPPKYAEIRINLAQAFNGIGTVVAPVLGSYVFFKVFILFLKLDRTWVDDITEHRRQCRLAQERTMGLPCYCMLRVSTRCGVLLFANSRNLRC